ncbi:MAG: helix-turn-helix domain-containing protein [Candidatus Nanoarchaeia archaeon]|nr:helix-turn-helix domain-containing protein [Candidatus Nanoarchaeia archaeon]
MIVSEEFLGKARSAFDLNEYEIKTWTALLSRGESTAGELAEISTVPRSRVYDILESLTSKGYVLKKNATPIRYKTVSPEEALKAAKKNAFRNADTKSAELEKIKSSDAFRDLDKFYKQGSEQIKTEVVGLIKGRKNLHAQLKAMVSEAKKTVVIVSTSNGLARKGRVLQAELKKAKDKGVSVKVLSSAESLPEELKGMAELRKHKSSTRFVIVDDKAVLFMMDDDKDVHEAYDTGIVVNSGFFAKGFEHLFSNHWEKM